MNGCPNCGFENPEDSLFCARCGTALGAVKEERRFLTILFADLVGFTAESDEADPEDVRARLNPYHERVRHEIERYGGTIEKLIGDGVMAVFGVPTAHEDDPERAVRAALHIQDGVEDLNQEQPGLELSVRIGINSGTAVVTTGGQAERIVGDVVNTASRIESVAPPGGVVVGEATYRATELLIEYEDLDAVEVKGKAQPLSIWRAIEPRGRYGVDAAVTPDTPFLGREAEMATLQENFHHVVDEGSLRLVTVAASPGVGKSRLVNEFWQWVDDRPEFVWWRQGRCLPYGEGITFWALGEIVKGQAGIRESDDPLVAGDKLATALEALVADESDRDWIATQLSPLVGAGSAGLETDRGEAFAAWRRFLEDLANDQPLIMVVEDIHWADEAFIEFLEDLLVWSADVPIMVICTARPELYEAHPGWGGGRRNSTTISLAPLGDDEIAQLVAALLSQAVLPADTQKVLLDRAGGNPLYAEEFVRMLTDRGVLLEKGRLADSADSIPVPETVQSLIGARLDLLPDPEREALQDAAVVGKVFWEGTLAAMGRTDDLRRSLRSLVEREWIRPARNSSVDGQREYIFWHLLTRDIAYGRIPRSARSKKHQAVAGWIKETTGDRVSDHAELIAHHYQQALELAHVAGVKGDLTDLEENALEASVLAGDRASYLDVGKAHQYYVQALESMPNDHPDRPSVLLKAGDLGQAGGFKMLEEAVRLLRERSDPAETGNALVALSKTLWLRRGTRAADETINEGIELLEASGPSEYLARGYASMAAHSMLGDSFEEALVWAEKALVLEAQFDLHEVRGRATSVRGIARFFTGDVPGGMADLREALDIARSTTTNIVKLEQAYTNLADHVWFVDGPEAGLEVFREGIDMLERRGGNAGWIRTESTWPLFDMGAWAELMDLTETLIEQLGDGQLGVWARNYRALVLAWRGDLVRASALKDEFLPVARDSVDGQIQGPALTTAGRIELLAGNTNAAVALTSEIGDWSHLQLSEAVRTFVAAGALDKAQALVDGSDDGPAAARFEYSTRTSRAMIAEASGDTDEALELYESVASDWESFGHKLEHALALYGSGRCLRALGRPDEGAERLGQAREILVELGTAPTVDEIDGLVDQAAAQ